MTIIIPIDPSQNIYTKDSGFKLIDSQDVPFEGRTVTKLTYRDTQSLIGKIGQVLLAVLLTVATLGLALCFRKGIIWKEALAPFKNQIVYQNIALQLTLNPSNSKPLNVTGTTKNPNGTASVPPQIALPLVVQTPPPPVPVAVQAPAPAVAPAPAAIVPISVTPATPNQISKQDAPPAPANIEKTTPAKTAPIPVPPLPPKVVLTNIVSQLKKDEILKENPEYSDVVKAWEKGSVSLADQVKQLEELKQFAFGTDKWVKYFGDITGGVPSLPEDIYQICNGNDHSKPGEKIKDTHVLVLVPAAVRVNGKRVNITLKNLGELVTAPKGGGHKTQYAMLVTGVHDHSPVLKPHWALMKKEVLPGSKNQPFDKQVEMVKEYSKQAKVQYNVPNAIDAVACCFMHFVDSGNRLFEGPGTLSLEGVTFTRCQELVHEVGVHYPVTVGDFTARSGLHAAFNAQVHDVYAIGVQRTF